MAPSAHSTGMSSVRRNVTSIGMSSSEKDFTREQAPVLLPKAEPRLAQEFTGKLDSSGLCWGCQFVAGSCSYFKKIGDADERGLKRMNADFSDLNGEGVFLSQSWIDWC